VSVGSFIWWFGWTISSCQAPEIAFYVYSYHLTVVSVISDLFIPYFLTLFLLIFLHIQIIFIFAEIKSGSVYHRLIDIEDKQNLYYSWGQLITASPSVESDRD
jgi:hypothetical protein